MGPGGLGFPGGPLRLHRSPDGDPMPCGAGAKTRESIETFFSHCVARPMQNRALASSTEFVPKLVTTLREGYGARELRADAIAGLTVSTRSVLGARRRG